MGDPSFSEKKCFGLAIRAEKHSAWSGEREPRRLIFKIYIPNLALRSIFNFEIVFTVRNKLNDFRVSRSSYVKYKFIF